MEIRYRDIILREMKKSDIEDWIRWYNVDTEWGDWDAPDEPIESVVPATYRAETLERIKKPLPDFWHRLELTTTDGRHIGRVTSYLIGEDWEWQSKVDAEKTGDFRWTLGLDICESQYWGSGLGTQALAAFVRYFLENEKTPIYLQTWSGNERMIRCARRLGFWECNRMIGDRQIRGGTYDSITFRLDETAFQAYLANNP